MNRQHCLNQSACAAKTPDKHCRSCAMKAMNADPDWSARRLAGLAKAVAEPDYRDRQSEGQKRALAIKMKDPAFVERLRENGRRYGAANLPLANKAEARVLAAAAIRAKHLAWCPAEFWPLNAQLKRNGIPLADRKRMIAEMIPGTPEHARLQLANTRAAMRLKHEREMGQRY